MMTRRQFLKAGAVVGGAWVLNAAGILVRPPIAQAAGFALLASCKGSGTTAAMDSTGANLIVVCLSGLVGEQGSGISDSKGNTWTPLTVSIAQAFTRLFYCFNPTVGSGHTFSGGQVYHGLTAIALSGALTSPFDQENGTTAASTTIQPGSVTPSQDNELIVMGIGMDSQSNADHSSIDSGMTVAEHQPAIFNTTFGNVIAYKIQTSAAAINPTETVTASNSMSARIATFKGGAPSGGDQGPVRRGGRILG